LVDCLINQYKCRISSWGNHSKYKRQRPLFGEMWESNWRTRPQIKPSAICFLTFKGWLVGFLNYIITWLVHLGLNL
jgi:hypothetical protein